MASNYVQPGDTQTYTNGAGSAIASGAVVKMQNTLGVALTDIAVGEAGEVMVRGVFSAIPKTAGTAFVHGDMLTWDVSAGAFVKGGTPATGDVSGCCTAFGAAASSATTALVLFHGNPGTIT